MKPVNAVSLSLDIHPYVKGRLRALPRHEESCGILLGGTERDVIHITGFKRIPFNALRQAAEAAGPAFAGFYRLQTTTAPGLPPAEEETWRQTSGPNGCGLFLLINGISGTATEATAWTLGDDGALLVERISLRSDAPLLPSTPARRKTTPSAAIPKWVFGAVAATLAVVGGAWYYTASRPPLALAIDLQARDGELTALWEQSGTSRPSLQSATLVIREGNKEQTLDLTRSYTPKGRVVIRPSARDVVLTLNVQYAGATPLSRTAVYLGFVPKTVEIAEDTTSRVTKKTGPAKRTRSRRQKASVSP